MRRLALRLGISLVLAVLLLLVLEGAASVWSLWSDTGQRVEVREITHCEYDPELGWMHRPDWNVPDLYGPGVGLTTNGQRLRGTREYSLEKPPDSYRILCLGDSFTMGYGVADEETYPAQLEDQDPRIEAINMGMGGFGIDQDYLWYLRDGVKFDVDVLLFTFIVGDFYRMTPKGNVANRAKPLLELVDGHPVAVNLPVPNMLDPPPLGRRLAELWEKSALASLLPKPPPAPARKRLPIAEEPFVPLALRIFEELRDLSADRGQLFVLAVLPTTPEIRQPRSELVDDWLVPALAERGIPFLDLRPAFKAVPRAELHECFVLAHYSARGNLIAARELLAGLRRLDPGCPR